MRATGSRLCVGLDPHPGRVRGTVLDHCRRVIDATSEHAVAFKPNSAFFEAAGEPGWRDLAAVIAHVPSDRLVILDAKRGDIGSTAEAYASAAFEVLRADAVTVSPYLGGDSVAPFLAQPEHGAFILCHTSNPGAGDLQHLEVGGEPLYLHVARLVATWGAAGNAGLVVGATYPAALAAVRAAAPALPILAPGIGAQGGDLRAALAAGLDESGYGLIVSSSRGIFLADDPGAAAGALDSAIRSEADAVMAGR